MRTQVVSAVAIALIGVFVGCSSEEPAQQTATPAESSGGHHHAAPHGGTLIELGDHFASIEFVFESESGTLTAYVLDAHAANPVRLTGGALFVEVELDGNDEYIPLELKGVANSLTGESEGDTSQFRGAERALRGQESFGITIPAVVVRGAAFENVSARID